MLRVRASALGTVGNRGNRWQPADVRARSPAGVIQVGSVVGGVLVGDRWETLGTVGYRWQVAWYLTPS